MNLFKRNEKRPRSLKFYLCLIGILAGVYLVLVGILAVRNPKQELDPVSTSIAVSESSSLAEWENKPQTIEEKPGRDKTGAEKPDKSVMEEEKSETDEYGRNGVRYTSVEAQDVFSRVNVSITNEEELERVVGVGIDQVKRFLNIYASHNGIEAQTVTILDYVFDGELAERMEIYMQYDDPDQTMVTVLFEPANANHSSHVDVIPCRYTTAENLSQ